MMTESYLRPGDLVSLGRAMYIVLSVEPMKTATFWPKHSDDSTQNFLWELCVTVVHSLDAHISRVGVNGPEFEIISRWDDAI